MAVTLREQILLNVEAGLAEITVANGYEQNVRRILRVPSASADFPEYPAVNIIDRGDSTKRLIQFCNEQMMTLELECFTREYVEDQSIVELARLMADVKKRMLQDETWDDLAIHTKVMQSGSSPFEVQQPLAVNRVTVEIHYREYRGNPYVQQVI